MNPWKDRALYEHAAKTTLLNRLKQVLWEHGETMNETNGLVEKRLSRPILFMRTAELHGLRSSCPRAKVGVTATRDNRVIASGYVGAPSGMPDCYEIGCDLQDGHCVRSVHAEANIISWCAREGISLKGSTLWCTYSPCYSCAKLICNLGIEQLIYANYYHGDEGRGVDLLMNQEVPAIPFSIVAYPA